MKTIYLSGHAFEYDYRQWCIENWSHMFNLIDPIGNSKDLLDKAKIGEDEFKNGIVIPDKVVTQIVEKDKNEIDSSDVMVAYIQKPTFGTIMEIMYAHDRDIPVYTVNPNEKFKNDVWLRYHSKKIFNSLDECFNYLESITKD